MSDRPDEGTLLAYLDGELAEDSHSSVKAWLERDPALAGELAELRTYTLDVREAVRALDEGLPATPRTLPPWLSAPSRPARSGWRAWGLGKAALLLLAGGVAAAGVVPGGWARTAWSALSEDAPEPAVESVSPTALLSELMLTPDLGRMVVRLEDVAEGTWVRVGLGEDFPAVLQATGTPTFDAGAGSVVVRAPGAEVTLAAPASITELEVWIEDRLFLSRRGGALSTPVMPTDQSPTLIRYRIGDDPTGAD